MHQIDVLLRQLLERQLGDARRAGVVRVLALDEPVLVHRPQDQLTEDDEIVGRLVVDRDADLRGIRAG